MSLDCVACCHGCRTFLFPEPVDAPLDLDHILEVSRPPRVFLPTGMRALANYKECLKKIVRRGGVLGKDPFVGDLEASPRFGPTLTYNYSPCLTRTRCGSGGYYLFHRGRKMLLSELFKLQGVPPGRIAAPKGVTQRQLAMMIGNSNDVVLLARIMSRVLRWLGYDVRVA